VWFSLRELARARCVSLREDRGRVGRAGDDGSSTGGRVVVVSVCVCVRMSARVACSWMRARVRGGSLGSRHLRGDARDGAGAPPAGSQLLLHSVRHRVVGLLKCLETQLGLMLAGDVPAYGVVPCEGTRAERAGHADALVPLTDVRSQVRLVTVKPLAERALELLTCNEKKTLLAHFYLSLF
jgi:hypothetical protein